MDVKSLHYSFKLAMDRIDKASSEDFADEEIDWLLTQAQLLFIKQRFNAQSNPKNRGFEGSQKRIDDLSTLLVKFPEQGPLTPIDHDGIYELPLATPLLKYDYLFLTTVSSKVEKDGCQYVNYLKFVQSDDLATVLQDPFNSPSLEFLPYNIGKTSTGTGSSLYIYAGGYKVIDVRPEYIRYPKRVCLGTYTFIDGTVPGQQTLETPEHTHEEIVDLACQLASLNIENPEYIQLKNQKILIQE